MKADVIIIGGGAAGIMAALSAKKSHPDKMIVLLDRTFAIGRKILVCGAGRCNITNHNLSDGPQGHYYGADMTFIESVMDKFSYREIVSFFADLGVEVYVEQKRNIGKLFPVTNRADTITEMLGDELIRQGVKIILNTDVTSVTVVNDKFQIKAEDVKTAEASVWESDYCIIAAGGKTYPALGSNGSGYTLAEKLGHNIIRPVPSALPLEAKNELSQKLQGTRVEMEVTAITDGKTGKKSTDEVMFTKYGLSGPAVLNVSREISIHLNREGKQNAQVLLNAFPDQDSAAVTKLLKSRWDKRPAQRLVKSLFGLFPNKVAAAFVEIADVDNKPVSELTDIDIARLVKTMTAYKVNVTATRGWNEAEFTAGGVDTAQVKPGTLESTLHKKLYFCGELLNVDGDVGGYNLSWAWASGYVAGQLSS